jgi:hypothetical protein
MSEYRTLVTKDRGANPCGGPVRFEMKSRMTVLPGPQPNAQQALVI